CRLYFARSGSIVGNRDLSGAERCGRDCQRDDAIDARDTTCRTLEGHLVGRSIEQPGEERLLGPDEIRDPRLDPGLAHQVINVNRATLSKAVDPADALLEHRRVPRKLDVDTGARGTLQVETDAAGIGRAGH